MRLLFTGISTCRTREWERDHHAWELKEKEGGQSRSRNKQSPEVMVVLGGQGVAEGRNEPGLDPILSHF